MKPETRNPKCRKIKNPMLSKNFFNTTCIANYKQKYEFQIDNVAPETMAMGWCMQATGIYRLFTKAQMHEFLLRLAISMKSSKLMENWFGWNKLFSFTVVGLPFEFCNEDLFKHIGMQVLKDRIDMKPRSEYLNSVIELINIAQLVGALGGNFQVIQPEKVKDDNGRELLNIDLDRETPPIDDDLIKKAQVFADDILKDVDPKIFLETDPQVNKKKEAE